MRVVRSSVAVSGSKRGSRNAAALALALTSASRVRCACRVPMQPRSLPWRMSVTNVAPTSCRKRVVFAGLEAQPQDIADGRARDRDQDVARVFGSGRGAGIEAERRVAHHAPAVAGGVARVAQIDELGLEALACRGQEQAVHRDRAAGLVRIQAGLAIEDGARGVAVGCLGLIVAEIVRQIGADDEQRVLVAPQALEHLRDFLRAGVADHQRYQRELAEHGLQKREVHFERVLQRVRIGAGGDLGQVAESRPPLPGRPARCPAEWRSRRRRAAPGRAPPRDGPVRAGRRA